MTPDSFEGLRYRNIADSVFYHELTLRFLFMNITAHEIL